MLAEVLEDELIVLQDRKLIPVTRYVRGKVPAIVFAFFPQQAARLRDLAAIMDVLDGLLQPMAISRPTTMVAMWMKKSRQVLAAW
jgi:hypothetical protein